MFKLCKYIGVICTCCFIAGQLCAQNTCTLQIYTTDSTITSLTQLQTVQTFSSKTSCLQYAEQLPAMLAAKGFISASVDSVKEDSSAVSVWLFIGNRYTWSGLSMDKNTAILLNNLGYNNKTFINKTFNRNEVDVIYKQLLDYYQNTGYPFARIGLDSMVLTDSLVSAKLSVEKGVEYYIDSIHVYGTAKLSGDFIYRYLDITKHEPYNNNKLNNIDQRLAELPYVQQSQPWSITMLNTGAILNLYLQPKHSNQFDVLVGFLPANAQLGGKLLLTGQANINLKNAFARGETIGVDWQQLQAKSPKLNLLFQRPYLFHSPLGIDFHFELYKRDSFYVNIRAQLGLQYAFSSKQTGTLFLQTVSTRLLSVDTNTVVFTKTLPETADISSADIGLQYNFNNTNYTLNPRNGNEVFIRASAGKKTVHKNNAITSIKDPDFNYNILYDTIKLKSYQLRLQANAAHYFETGKQAAFKTAINIGVFQSPSFYVNELFQIGGYRLLRGFDEESVYTNRYVVATIEYRYLLAQNSYFSVFSDIGNAHYQTNAASFGHTYIGAGFGLAFETKTGIFNISYATGKRDDAKFDLRQSKIHLGFSSLF